MWVPNVTRCSKTFNGCSFPNETLQHPWPGTKDSPWSHSNLLFQPYSHSPALSVFTPLQMLSIVFSVPLSSHHKYKPSLQVTFRIKSFPSSQPQVFSSSSEYPQHLLCLFLVQMIFSFIMLITFSLQLDIFPVYPTPCWTPPPKCPIGISNSFPKSNSLSFPPNLFSSYDPFRLLVRPCAQRPWRRSSFLCLSSP